MKDLLIAGSRTAETNGSAHAPVRSDARSVAVSPGTIRELRAHSVLSRLLPVGAGYASGPSASGRGRAGAVDHATFVLCTRGRGWCELQGRRFNIGAGDLLVIAPGVFYTYGSDARQPWTILWVHALGSNVDFFLDELGGTRQNAAFGVGDDPRLVALFQEILTTIEASRSVPAFLCASQALAHLLGTVVWSDARSARPEQDAEGKIEQSIAYMNQHLNRPLQVATLAALAGMSPSHYTAVFKRQTGYAPIDYFIRLRMGEACRLLEVTVLSVKEIAATLGYDDPFYFSRIFKTVNGAAPTDYRASRRADAVAA
jgi:AraC family transcriptional regulator, arabinose operon regulatory protein